MSPTAVPSAAPAAPPHGLGREQLLELYYYMRLTRSLEERLVNLYRQTKVIGGLFRSLGQEADSVGSAYALDRTKGDILSPLIRNLGSMLVQGATPLEVLRQYMAKAESPTARPRAQHPFQRSRARLHRPDLAPGRHGAGHGRRDALVQDAEAAPGRPGLRRRRRDEHRRLPRGDQLRRGAAAARWSSSARTTATPLSTPMQKQTAVTQLVDKAAAYGIPGVRPTATTCSRCTSATKPAVERARKGGGCTLIELVTYRRKGHAEHDNQSYVPKEELAAWEAKDPIDRYVRRLTAAGWATRRGARGHRRPGRRASSTRRWRSARTSRCPRR